MLHPKIEQEVCIFLEIRLFVSVCVCVCVCECVCAHTPGLSIFYRESALKQKTCTGSHLVKSLSYGNSFCIQATRLFLGVGPGEVSPSRPWKVRGPEAVTEGLTLMFCDTPTYSSIPH